MKLNKFLYAGLVFAITGLILLTSWVTICNTVLHSKLTLSNASLSFKLWKEPPIPIHLSVYLFNWTNADAVIDSRWKIKPQLEERGPFVFLEHHVRDIISWNKDDTVTYQQRRIWKYMPELSNGSLYDNITSVNPIVAILANKVKAFRYISPIVNSILWYYSEKIFITKTVNEWLFEGYEDPIISRIIGYQIPGLEIPFDRIGWFYSRNNSATYEGVYTIHTGGSNIGLLGEMNLWNGRVQTDAYEGSCASIQGSSGELYPPFNQKQRQLSIFLADICSTITLERQGVETVFGINGAKFIGTDYNFDNGTKYNTQKCFNKNGHPSGAREISKCKYDAPAFVSYPHFYLGDPSYGSRIKGLTPNRIQHETHITLEPNTGIPLNASAKLQLNLFVEPVEGMSVLESVVPTYMPILWFQEDASLTEKYCNLIEIFKQLSQGGFYLGCFMLVVGMSTIALTLCLMNGLIGQRRDGDLLVNEESGS